jgi:ABC-2 type transport system permease protein
MGAFVSVAVQEVFEAQTLANFFRFPMIFLCGVFVPLTDLPPALQVIARALPITYSGEALQATLLGTISRRTVFDLGALAGFTALFFILATGILQRRPD